MRLLTLRLTIFFLVGIALAACSGAGGAAKPIVIIQSPAEGSQFREGEDISIRSTLQDPTGVVSAELFVDGANVRSDTVASQPDTRSVAIVQRWKAAAGVHVIGVRAFNRAGLVSELATVTVAVVASTADSGPTATRAASIPPAVTASPVAAAPPVNTASAAPSATSIAADQPGSPAATPPVSTLTAASALSPFQLAIKATVFVMTPLDARAGYSSNGSGSVVDADGLILTNFHVVRDLDSGALLNSSDLTYVAFSISPNREPSVFYQVKAVALDQDLDLAVLKITATEDGKTLPPDLGLAAIPLGNSDSVQIGERIQIIGYPGLGGRTITATEGIVSGFLDNGAWIKTDTQINPGNSGGLAINAAGELIGVPSRHIFDPELVGKYGMVRPINPAKALLDKARWLSSLGYVEPPPQPAQPSQPTAAPPSVPPGMYATGLSVIPAEPKNGDHPTFKVTFLNNLGVTAYYNWFVKVYEPDKRNSFGETAKLNSTFPPGITTLDSMANWKAAGGSPCRPYFARVFYAAPDGTIVEFPKPGGDTVQQYFTVCP